MKKFLSLLMTLILVLGCFTCTGVTASAAEARISLPYKNLTISKGKAVTLKPTVKGLSKYTLQWSSSDKTVVSVSSKGKASALKEGTATITVKVKGTNSSASVKIHVGKRVTSVKLSDSKVTLKKGDTYKLTVNLSPIDAAYMGYTFSVSDKSVAKIDSKGTVTALKNGTSEITVKAADGSGVKSVLTVTVSDKAPADNSGKPAAKGFDTTKTAFDITKAMKVGWNLGNSLDAIGGSGLSSETSWGNPKTTKDLIDDIKNKGFTSIRIPVSWGIHADSKGNINKEWLARVKEVVDYAYNDGMYVILNSHHDNAYYDIGGCGASDKVLEANLAKMTNLWTQIANTFKDYSEKLVFETLNEPRTEGSPNEWNGGTASEREIVAAFNDAIVKAIRATGGNNAYRFIMVPAYAATSSTNILRSMEIPDDDRVIVSVHAYSPYLFAMVGNASAELSDSDRLELDRFFANLNSIFISKGRAVVIGEMGCTNMDNLLERCEWADYYVRGAKKYGIPCFVWDNNSKTSVGNECFGLYDRDRGEWVFPEIAEALISAAK